MIIIAVKYILYFPSIATFRTSVLFFIPQPHSFTLKLHFLCFSLSLTVSVSSVLFSSHFPLSSSLLPVLYYFFLICDSLVSFKDPIAMNISFTAVIRTLRSGAVGSGTALKARRSRVRYCWCKPIKETYKKNPEGTPGISHWHNPSRPHYDPGVDSATNRNK